jgi:hypothetical protein
MTIAGIPGRLAAGATIAAFATAFFCHAAAIAGTEGDAIKLVPHRAVYDLKLAKSYGKRSVESVRGRILYDFTGSACEGYSLQFRQVSELDTGEDKVAVSDLRASTWEEGNAQSFRFTSENFLNDALQETVNGRAERGADGVAATLTKPGVKSLKLDAGMVFPTEHVRRAIAAGRVGKSILEFQVYDGSENGEKIYNSLTVIGHAIAPGEKKPDDAAANEPALVGLRRWPVTISYFDKSGAGGEQTPVYAISFELYENGVSRNLLLDYGDFTVAGEMTQLEIKDAKQCP